MSVKDRPMNARLVTSIVLILLALIFVAQNTEMVRVTFLLWAMEMSLALFILMLLVIGMLAGWMLRSYYRHHRRRRTH